MNLKSPVIPVLFESSLAIPESLRSLQYADFRQGATGIAVARLMGALNSLQKVAAGDSPEIPTAPKGIPSRAWENAGHWTDHIVTQRHEPIDESEKVVGKFGVSLFRKGEAIGGRVILTNQRLLFEAHGMNFQRDPQDLSLANVVGLVTFQSWGIFPNGVILKYRSGEECKLIMFNRKQFIDSIERLLGIAHSELK